MSWYNIGEAVLRVQQVTHLCAELFTSIQHSQILFHAIVVDPAMKIIGYQRGGIRLDNCKMIDSAAKLGWQRYESEDNQRLRVSRIVYIDLVSGKKKQFLKRSLG